MTWYLRFKQRDAIAAPCVLVAGREESEGWQGQGGRFEFEFTEIADDNV